MSLKSLGLVDGADDSRGHLDMLRAAVVSLLCQQHSYVRGCLNLARLGKLTAKVDPYVTEVCAGMHELMDPIHGGADPDVVWFMQDETRY